MPRMIGLCALALLSISSPMARADDWAEFCGPRRDSVSTEKGLNWDWKSAPPVSWTADLGPGFGGAAVRDGRVAVIDRVDDTYDVLRVYELDSGKVLWSKSFEAPGRLQYNGSRSVPTMTADAIYASGPFGHIYAVAADGSKVLWQKDLTKDYGMRLPNFGFSCSPLVHGDSVVLALSMAKAGVLALNAKDGKELWSTPGIRGQSYESCVLRELAGVKQITVQIGAEVLGLNPSDGKVLWSFTGYGSRNPIPQATQIDADKLFLTAGYGAGSKAIRIAREGEAFKVEQVFDIRRDGAQVHSAIRFKDHLYANFNTNENLRRDETMGIVCLDLSGKILWSTAGKPAVNRGPVLLVDDHILSLGGEDGVLRAFEPNPAKYTESGSIKLFTKLSTRNNNIWAPLALSNGRLVARSQSELKVLDLRLSSAGKGTPAKPEAAPRRFSRE